MNYVPFNERPTCRVDEACHATGMSRSKIWKEMQDGNIAFTHAGGRRLVLVPSLLAYLTPEKKAA